MYRNTDPLGFCTVVWRGQSETRYASFANFVSSEQRRLVYSNAMYDMRKHLRTFPLLFTRVVRVAHTTTYGERFLSLVSWQMLLLAENLFSTSSSSLTKHEDPPGKKKKKRRKSLKDLHLMIFFLMLSRVITWNISTPRHSPSPPTRTLISFDKFPVFLPIYSFDEFFYYFLSESVAIGNLHQACEEWKKKIRERNSEPEFHWPVKYHHSDITIHFTFARLARYEDIIFIAPPRVDFGARALHKLSNLLGRLARRAPPGRARAKPDLLITGEPIDSWRLLLRRPKWKLRN